jgi:hypothetical protein
VVIALYGRRLVTDDVLARELDEDMRVIARTDLGVRRGAFPTWADHAWRFSENTSQTISPS